MELILLHGMWLSDRQKMETAKTFTVPELCVSTLRLLERVLEKKGW